MNADTALEFIDRLVYAKTEKRLNDLERKVFLGSWEGKTYKDIYPHNPEYIQNSVAYRLWHKLRDILGEKINKKKLHGVVERAVKQQKQLAIVYREQILDTQLAQALKQGIQSTGYAIFLMNLDTILSSDFEENLTYCNYFILVLSARMATSEILIDLLKRIREQQETPYNREPWLLVIYLWAESPFSLNHAVRNYLEQAWRYRWKKSEDKASLIQKITNSIQTGNAPPVDSDMLHILDNHTKNSKSSEFSCSSSKQPLLSFITSPPSPVAEPELPRGQVRLASAFYVERHPQDSLCHETILKPGALIRIKAPRQMGKTSLMARILSKSEEQGYHTIPLSFQHADREIFSRLDLLLRWLCMRVARKLKLPPRLEDFWTDTYGSKDNCTAYFEDYLLSEIETPLVLGMDEVDRVFEYPDIVDDFFGLLRAWYEEAGYGVNGSSLWEKIRLVVVHSTEGYIPLDINQSPFNVGLPIELKEFNLEQVTDLAHRHGLSWSTNQIKELMILIGGHPYLVGLAFYQIIQQQLTWKQLLNSAPTELGIYGDHLRRHLWNLNRDPVLATAFSQVLASPEPISLESIYMFKLHSLGLIKLQKNGVVPRFELYRQYFRDRLNQ